MHIAVAAVSFPNLQNCMCFCPRIAHADMRMVEGALGWRGRRGKRTGATRSRQLIDSTNLSDCQDHIFLRIQTFAPFLVFVLVLVLVLVLVFFVLFVFLTPGPAFPALVVSPEHEHGHLARAELSHELPAHPARRAGRQHVRRHRDGRVSGLPFGLESSRQRSVVECSVRCSSDRMLVANVEKSRSTEDYGD